MSRGGGAAWELDFGPSSRSNARLQTTDDTASPPADPYARRPPRNRPVGAESMDIDWARDHPNAKKAPTRAVIPPSLAPGRRRDDGSGGGAGGGGRGRGRGAPAPREPWDDGSGDGGGFTSPSPVSTALTARGSRGGRGGRGGALTTRPSPESTAFELQKNYQGPAKTAKGRAIQEDLRNLADDYFGGVVSKAPPTQLVSDPTQSRYAKFVNAYTSSAVPRRWREGPADSAGRVFDASDRNLLCMDVLPSRTGSGRSASGPLCVVGSADHGLKVFDVATMKEKKNLYTKACGHTEWVTTCKFLSTGQVLSGGMDSKLCLWDSVLSGPPRCRDLLGHTGSISQVDVNTDGTAVSASYDRTLRIWDCSAGGHEMGCLSGHKAPVLQFAWAGTQIISGDRQGQAKVWDLPTASCLATLATKRGQIGALSHLLHSDFGNLTMFGDQGGVLTVLDLRQGKAPVFQQDLHPGGVLSGIKTTPDAPYVITCGADRRILVLDPRQNFETVCEFTDHQDFIYSMETFGSLVLSGASNGWLLVHDTKTGKCCYGLGANAAAVREIFASPEYLVCAGDDGKATVYNFDSVVATGNSKFALPFS